MRAARHRGSVRVASMVTLLLLLAGCSTWRPVGPDDVAGAAAPSPSGSSITASASPDEAATPVAALRRLYAVVDRLDADPSVPVSRLDAVAVGPARDALASAVRHRRATGPGRPVPETELSQIVVRPSVRSEDTVSAALQFCANRQIDAGSQPDRQELRPTTLTFRYASGRWLAYTFGFDSADCGCSLPVQCG